MLNLPVPALGQQTSAQSLPVTIASDQTAIPVTLGAALTADLSFNQGAGGVYTATIPTLDTTTPGNNRGIPQVLLAGSGLGPVAVGAGATSATTLRVVLPTDQSAIPVSQSGSWTIALPSNAAQETGGNLAAINGKLNSLGQKTMANSMPVVIASDQSTLTISGAVTANIGTTNGLALDATVGQVQGSASGGSTASKSSLSGGIFNSVLPTLTNGQQAGMQLSSAGRLLVDGSGVTQPISGSVSLTGSIQVSGTGTAGTPATGVITVQGITSMTALKVDGSAVTQPVSGTVGISGTVAATQSGTWTVQPGNTQNTTAWLTQDAADGPVAPGTAATKSILGGGVYNSTPPTLTNGQQAALQLDANGSLKTYTDEAPPAPTGRSSVLVYRNDNSSVNITTAAYVQVVASTTGAINRLYVGDTSGQAFIIATGAAASEVDQIYVPPGGIDSPYEITIPASTRVSVKALGSNMTAGQLIITGLS